LQTSLSARELLSRETDEEREAREKKEREEAELEEQAQRHKQEQMMRNYAYRQRTIEINNNIY
jgi:hypothetical protein